MKENFLSPSEFPPSQLIMPADLAEELEVREYKTAQGGRVLDVPAPLDELHDWFANHGIAVPSIQFRDAERVRLQIPARTQIMSQILGSVATDPKRYSEVFKGIGIQMKRAREIGYGVTPIDRRGILGSIALSLSEKGRDVLFFVPPYPLRRTASLESASCHIAHELINSGHFAEESGMANANHLLYQILLGIGTPGGRRRGVQ